MAEGSDRGKGRGTRRGTAAEGATMFGTDTAGGGLGTTTGDVPNNKTNRTKINSRDTVLNLTLVGDGGDTNTTRGIYRT